MKPDHGDVGRRRFRITGVVQGVGFRPFVYGLAVRRGLGGFVLNDASGVVVEAEGAASELDDFAAALRRDAPSLARVENVVVEVVDPRGESEFRIEASAGTGTATALIPADVATCDDCLRELFDPADRRHRYPFINCTQCGPRFTIVVGVPYDRARTTMAGFPLCDECRAEYEDPAVKGLGGYHLACDAADEDAVARLRVRKYREDKPFALMTNDPGELAHVTPEEDALLQSPERPIVLLRRRHDAAVAPSVAPATEWLGVMRPYTPLHHLLLHDFVAPLVMTSGNRSDEPIAFDDDDARRRLDGIADVFLTHDRPIHRRCEDSVVRAAFPVRRSRGSVPHPLPLPASAPRTIVAAGAHLKNTFCVARGADAYLSAHLGDLDSDLAYTAFQADLELYLQMLGAQADVVAHDLHPEYLSTKWAYEQDAELVGVQHHHAHAAACLAEHGEVGPAVALVYDGTGFGIDGTLWGGEVLRCDLASYERLAHLTPIALAGGEAAVREPWRVAAAYLERAGRGVPFADWARVRSALAVNAPLSSGMGRLFDAVAAILGVRERVTYEGQAAIELEQLAGDVAAEPYEWSFGDGAVLVGLVADDIAAGRSREEIAAAFHETVAAASAAACLEVLGDEPVALSGGTFQNLRLLASTRARLEREGARVLTHRQVPPNDGGISYGQAAVAAARLSDG
jgi:hydrogenase maturation protein HypF